MTPLQRVRKELFEHIDRSGGKVPAIWPVSIADWESVNSELAQMVLKQGKPLLVGSKGRLLLQGVELVPAKEKAA